MLKNTHQEIHKVKLALAFGELDGVMSWCRENCIHNWHIRENDCGVYTHEMGYGKYPSTYTFEFEDERDFLTFSLKYK
jgi:hypothetical protein